MLSWLKVSGFALIDTVELPFGPGLTVITGETGAGKSILIAALGLLRGGRASADVIRAGREEAEVEAIFEIPPKWPGRAALEEDGRSLEEGLVVRRVVARTARGRTHLGGRLATVGELATSVGSLVDITSQHDQQSLMDPESQLGILDAFAENGSLVDAARAAWQTLADAQAALVSYEAEARARAEREDYLRFQLTELEEAALVPDEDETLKVERDRIRSAERFAGAFSRGEEVLYSSDAAVIGQIAGVARDLEGLLPLDPSLGPLVERLRGAQSIVEDVAVEIGHQAGRVRFDPERLTQIEERLYLIARLCRKHGGTLASVLDRQQVVTSEVAQVESFESGLIARRAAVEEATVRLGGIADRLSERRRKSARTLGKRIDETLRELGLREAALSIVVEEREAAGPSGRDRVKFLFTPNLGEEPRPLARIASGGELSRVMLAVKRALARADQALTYIFDEVDTGVGGGTAEVIGHKLKAIAADRQVLAVTHLPQIAAFADHHIHVEKETTGGRTTVRMQVLDDKGRAAELARMLGGARPSREAAAHADQMLRRARKVAA